MGNLEQKIGELFGNLPPMSQNARETTAKVLPWVVIVLGVLGLFAMVSMLKMAFGFMGAMHLAGYMGSSFYVWITVILGMAVSVLQIYGGYLMLSRKRLGWLINFYGLLFGFVNCVVAVSIFGLIINILVGYLLFQIRDMFTA